MMTAPDPRLDDAALVAARRRRRRSIAIALALAAFVVIFYVLTLVKLGPNILMRDL